MTDEKTDPYGQGRVPGFSIRQSSFLARVARPAHRAPLQKTASVPACFTALKTVATDSSRQDPSRPFASNPCQELWSRSRTLLRITCNDKPSSFSDAAKECRKAGIGRVQSSSPAFLPSSEAFPESNPPGLRVAGGGHRVPAARPPCRAGIRLSDHDSCGYRHGPHLPRVFHSICDITWLPVHLSEPAYAVARG